MKQGIFLVAALICIGLFACKNEQISDNKTIKASTDLITETSSHNGPTAELSKGIFYALQENNLWNFSEMLPSINDYEQIVKQAANNAEAEKQAVLNLNENYHHFSAKRKHSFLKIRQQLVEANIDLENCNYSHDQLLKDESGTGHDRIRVYFKSDNETHWIEAEECTTLNSGIWYLIGDLNFKGEQLKAVGQVHARKQEYGADANEAYKPNKMLGGGSENLAKLFDQSNSSAWQAEKEKPALKLFYTPKKDLAFTSLSIFNGAKNYAAAKEIKLSVNNKTHCQIHLLNTDKLQQVLFPDIFLKKGAETEIRLEILSAYGSGKTSIRDLYFSPH